MVDSGNLYDVAKEIKIPATIKLTEALTISKAGISKVLSLERAITGFLKLESIFSCKDFGKIEVVTEDNIIADRTIPLDRKFG